MAKKKAEEHVPGWGEVILGATLSLVLGVALGVVYLVIKPVTVVKKLPDPVAAGDVYFIEGSHDAGKAKQAAVKRKAFASAMSGTLTVTEDEINTIVLPVAAAVPPAAKPGEKGAAADKPADAPSTSGLTPGSPNFRFHDGLVQIGVPAKLSIFGLEQSVLVQANGSFTKNGDTFVFVPASMTLGSCPLERLPIASTFVTNSVLHQIKIPDDITASWSKLTAVAVDGNTLKVTMP